MSLSGNWVYVWELTKLFCQSTFLCHCIACVYHLVGLVQYEYLDEQIYGQVWFDITQSWSQRYIQSFYWALSSMMGGSTSGQTFIETLFSCLVMMGTVAVFATILGTIQIILEDIQKKSKDYKKSKEILTQFFKNQPNEVVIPQQLKSRLSNYLRYYYIGHEDMKQAEDFENIMQNLPEALQESIKIVRFTSLINKFTMLKNNFTPYVMDKLVDYVQEEYYMPNQIIFQQGEYRNPKLFLVVKGSINLEYSLETNAIETLKKQQLKGFKKDWKISKQNKRKRQEKLREAQPQLQKFQKYEKLILNTISNSTLKTKHEVYLPKTTKKRNVTIQTVNDINQSDQNYFGESFFFTDKTPDFTARSSSFTTLLSIGRDQFLEIIKDSQQDFEKFHYFKDCIWQQGSCERVYKQCILCKSLHHNLHNCKLLRYNPNKLNVIAKHNFYEYNPETDLRNNQFKRILNPRQQQRKLRLQNQLNSEQSLYNSNLNLWSLQHVQDKVSEIQIKCWQREDELSNKYYELLEILEKFQPYDQDDELSDQYSSSDSSEYTYNGYVSQITEESQSQNSSDYTGSQSIAQLEYQDFNDNKQVYLTESEKDTPQSNNTEVKEKKKIKINLKLMKIMKQIIQGQIQKIESVNKHLKLDNQQNNQKLDNNQNFLKPSVSPMYKKSMNNQIQSFQNMVHSQNQDLQISQSDISISEDEFMEGQKTQRIKESENIQSQKDHYNNNNVVKQQYPNLKKFDSSGSKKKKIYDKNSILQIIQEEIQKLKTSKQQKTRKASINNENQRKNSVRVKKKELKSFNKVFQKKKNSIQTQQNRRKSLFSQDIIPVNKELFQSSDRRQSIMSTKSQKSIYNNSNGSFTPGQILRNKIQNQMLKHGNEIVDPEKQNSITLQLQHLKLINDIQQLLEEKQQESSINVNKNQEEYYVSFDKLQNYKWYFPWNNQTNVCQQFKKLMKRVLKMKQVVKAFEENAYFQYQKKKSSVQSQATLDNTQKNFDICKK